MDAVLDWMQIVFLLGGTVIAFVGTMWHKGSRLLDVLADEKEGSAGIQLCCLGLLMMVLGYGVMRPRPPPTRPAPDGQTSAQWAE